MNIQLKKIVSFHQDKRIGIPSQRAESFKEILTALKRYIFN